MKSEPEKTRIFVETTLKEGEVLTIPQKQEHYLLDVLRLKRGALISLFNGHDGEFVGKLQSAKKKNCSVQVEFRIRPQERTRDLTLLFAPVKKARLDFIAQKASELGVKTIWPVKTDYCQISRVNERRLVSNSIEAAEQTGRLDVAQVMPFEGLGNVLRLLEPDRLLIWCDEDSSEHFSLNIVDVLFSLPKHKKAAILVGPEGGFSSQERKSLEEQNNCLKISLGPRILRADTAAISALSIYQSICGDWRG